MRRDTNKWESSDTYDNFRLLFSTLKSMETASRTRNGWESGFWRQLGQLGTTFSRCAAQPGGEREEDGIAGGSPTELPVSNDWKSSARFPSIGKRGVEKLKVFDGEKRVREEGQARV